MFTTNECFVRRCPILPFNCRYQFSTKVNICRNSETTIKRFIMFLDYFKLQRKKIFKVSVINLLTCEKILISQMVFLLFFLLSFLAVISTARNCHCLLHQTAKKEFNIYIIYMIKLEILIIYIQFD